MKSDSLCASHPSHSAARHAADVHELLSGRWSPRSFARRDIARETLAALFEAARMAPSSFNEQPWSFVVADRRNREDFSRMLGILNERNREWAAQAPLLLLVLAGTRLARSGTANPFAFYDAGHAVGNLTAQAVAEGLQVHQMGGFDREAARAAFRVPADREPVVVIAAGYPAEEQPPKKRAPLSTFVFEGEWGQAAAFPDHDSQVHPTTTT